MWYREVWYSSTDVSEISADTGRAESIASNLFAIKKLKWSRYRPGVAQRVGRGIALLFHGRGNRRWWVVSSTPRPQFTPRRDQVPILQEAGWAPGLVWNGGKSRPHRDSIPDLPSRSSVTITTELPGLGRHRGAFGLLCFCCGATKFISLFFILFIIFYLSSCIFLIIGSKVYFVEASWNVMAHAEKPDFVFRAKRTSPFKSAGGRQFSQLLTAEVCASAVVMLDTPCSEVVWRVLATHCIRQSI